MDPQLQDCLTAEQIGFAKRILDELELLFSVEVSFNDSPEVHAVDEIRAALRVVAREIGDQIKRIESNRDLSNVGRTKAYKVVGDAVRPRLANLEKSILPRLQARLDALRAELAAPMSPLQKGDAVAAIRQMEIRNRLGVLDDASRIAAMWTAVERGDSETLAAFASAPTSFPLVEQEALTQAMDAYWRQEKPDVVEAVEVVETLVEMLATNFRSLHRVCDNLSGAISTDPAGDGNE